MNPITFTRSVRSLNRIRQIAQVLTRHGFGHIVAQIDLTRFLPVWMLRKKRVTGSEEGESAIGQRLATVCSELGPTFIKLGQSPLNRHPFQSPIPLPPVLTMQTGNNLQRQDSNSTSVHNRKLIN